MSQYIIDEEDLRALIESNYRLRALSVGGVRSWAWYNDAIHNYLDQVSAVGFKQLVDDAMSNFEMVKANLIYSRKEN